MNDNVYCKQDVECIMLRVVTLVHNVTLFIKIILCECYRRQRMGRTNIKHVYTRCEPQAQVLQPSAGQLPKPRNRPYFEPLLTVSGGQHREVHGGHRVLLQVHHRLHVAASGARLVRAHDAHRTHHHEAVVFRVVQRHHALKHDRHTMMTSHAVCY